MQTLWLNLEHAPVGARVAHGLLRSVLEQVRKRTDRTDLEPLDDTITSTLHSVDWDNHRQFGIFRYSTAIYSVDVGTGIVCENRNGATTVYSAAGTPLETAGPTTIKLHDVRSRTTAPPAPSRN